MNRGRLSACGHHSPGSISLKHTQSKAVGKGYQAYPATRIKLPLACLGATPCASQRMSAVMQTTQTLCSSRHRLEANGTASSFRQLEPSPLPPIIADDHLQWSHLLLGRNQASIIPASVAADRIVIDVVDDDVDGLQQSHTFVQSIHIASPDTEVVKLQDDTPSVARYSPPRFDIGSYSSVVEPYINRTSSPHEKLDVSIGNASVYIRHTTTRALTQATDELSLTMAATVSAPGSPPDLSGSRSSKTSSYCSSHTSNVEGIATDNTNFEEIGLEDDHASDHKVSQKKQADRSDKPVSKVNVTTTAMGVEQRHPLPNLSEQIREAIRQKENELSMKRSKRFGSMKRNVTSPVPTLGFTATGAVRTRSASPPKTTIVAQSTTPSSADTLRPQWTSLRLSLPPPSRRGSWQPSRRSVQELEADCHDSDDELPEEASLWNVPVSPHPNGIRSHRTSFIGSPSRDPGALGPKPIPLEHATTAPDTPPRSGKASQTLPRQRPLAHRSATLSASLSNPSSPRSKYLRRMGRANSWNLAMGDLSEEARVLTQNLEQHAETMRLSDLAEGRPSSGDSATSQTSTSSGKILLPPIQQGNLDFMPISKEKEAILSRTRPSWLPPKDPREEKKHLKEYQRMMSASLETEKRRLSQTKGVDAAKESDTRAVLSRIWHYYCEDDTDITMIDKRVFNLCWTGITPKLRGSVWHRAVGNALGLTDKSYEKALSRAADIQIKPIDQLSDNERSVDAWFKDIERDAETAFPELNLFQRKGLLWQDLVDVCKAYVCYRADIGYRYGVQLVAALLLLQVNTPQEAFVLLANSLNRPLPLALHSHDIAATARTYDHAVSTLAIKFPRLHEYLFGSIEQGGLGFTAELIFEPMLRTLFSNGLDVDRLCRVWDIWVFKGDKALVYTAVAVLGCLQAQIFDISGDIDLKRRNIQEMLAWGPFCRTTKSGVWSIPFDEEKFVEEISLAGTLDYRGR